MTDIQDILEMMKNDADSPGEYEYQIENCSRYDYHKIIYWTKDYNAKKSNNTTISIHYAMDYERNIRMITLYVYAKPHI